jgi:hypothetical protein
MSELKYPPFILACEVWLANFGTARSIPVMHNHRIHWWAQIYCNMQVEHISPTSFFSNDRG